MLTFANVFLTVGTTRFDDLVDVALSHEALVLLKEHGCRQLTVQYGAGKAIDAQDVDGIWKTHAIKVDCYDFKANIASDIASSDLVLSHAGAGSCIEVLTAKKPLIVVVNDKLMHNHQVELAQQLHIDGYLCYCTPNTLTDLLEHLDHRMTSLKPYEPIHGNMAKFVDNLKSLMGFE